MPERELNLYKNAHSESDHKTTEAPKMPSAFEAHFAAVRIQGRRNRRIFRLVK